jgi:hypothetical protein
MSYYSELYDINGNILFRYKGNEQSIMIPPLIDGHFMLYIGKEAFARKKGIKKISIASSYISIGAMAFMGCPDLEEIIIPDSVITIGSFAFACCPKLKTIKMEKPPLSAGNNILLGSPAHPEIVWPKDAMTEILDDEALNETLGYVG